MLASLAGTRSASSDPGRGSENKEDVSSLLVPTLPLDEEEQLPRVIGRPDDPLGGKASGEPTGLVVVLTNTNYNWHKYKYDITTHIIVEQPTLAFFPFGSSFLPAASDFLFSPPFFL